MPEFMSYSIVLLIMVILVSSTPCYPRTWRVPSEIPTVTEAADSAVWGDSILVAAGTYICSDGPEYRRAWADLRSGVSLIGAGMDSTLVIDQTTEPLHYMVMLEEAEDCLVKGFSFARERIDGDFMGAELYRATGSFLDSCSFDHFFYGIVVSGASGYSSTPRVRYCRVSHCGLGIYCYSTEAYYSPLIRFCTLLDNSWAIELWDSRAYILDSYIARSSRAGVYCHGCSPATLDRNTIVDGQRYGILVQTDVFCEPYLTTSWVPSNANNIYGNAWCDLCNDVEDQRGLVEARYNYWGSDCPDFETIICGPGRVNYLPWVDSTHTYVYDECPPQATEPSTWGRVKAMFR
jgi:hypothetical protein